MNPRLPAQMFINEKLNVIITLRTKNIMDSELPTRGPKNKNLTVNVEWN